MKWILRDGQTIRVWEDHWIPDGSLRSRIEGPLMPNEEQRLVSSLRDNHIWRLEDLEFPLSTQLEQLIQGTLWSATGSADALAKRGNQQKCLLEIYDTCLAFV